MIERKFSKSLYTEETVPEWRKCDLTFTAERLCRVEAAHPWEGFRFEGPALPVTLQPGEIVRIRLANETGIPSMGGVVLDCVHFERTEP